MLLFKKLKISSYSVFYDGSVGTMMSALVRQNDLSLDDIHELQQILKDAESKAKKSKE